MPEGTRIDIAARVVDAVGTEHSVVLSLSGGVEVRIETPFELSAPGSDPLVVDPECLGRSSKLVHALQGRIFARAKIDGDGSLVVGFDDESSLRVPSDADYEAWAVTHADGAMTVALPGGGVSVWAARRDGVDP